MAELTFVAEVAEMFPPLPPHVVFVYSRLWYFSEKSFFAPKVVPKIYLLFVYPWYTFGIGLVAKYQAGSVDNKSLPACGVFKKKVFSLGFCIFDYIDDSI